MTMTTFFDPPDLQAICLRLSRGRGFLNGLVVGRAGWTLEHFLAHPPAVGLSADQIDARRREIVVFLNNNKLMVKTTDDDATITFLPFATYPYVEPIPPSLIACKQGQTIVCGYAQLHRGIVPITKCLVWDDTIRRGRFVIGFVVGERNFRMMPEGWMLEQGTERVCNEALARDPWHKTEREAVDHAESLVYPFQVRNMALNGELPDCLVDLERPPADVDVLDPSPEDDMDELAMFFVP